jgi:hypothetical protein
MNKIQTVYIPTSISTSKLQVGTIDERDYYKGFDKITNVNEVERFVFTPEELKQLLSDTFDAGNKSGLAGYSNISYHTQYDKQQYIENFLNKEK